MVVVSTPRSVSLKRSVVAALSPSPYHNQNHSRSSTVATSATTNDSSRIPSGASTGGDSGGTPGGSSSRGSRGRGLWQRASTGWSNGNNGTTAQQDLAEENRPMTLPAPRALSGSSRGRSLSRKKMPPKSAGGSSGGKGSDRASTVSPSGPGSAKGRGSAMWASVAAALSPGLPPTEQGTAES